jgi:predicted acetyltransferase
MSSSIITQRNKVLDGLLANIIQIDGLPTSHGTVTVSPAQAGDHGPINRFLQNIFRKPTSTDFAAQLEDPQYEPSDRIVARLGNQIIGHARVQMRDIHFGDLQLPIGYVCEVATNPEFRQHGIGAAMLKQVHHLMAEQGAAIGLLKTPAVRFYQNNGWFVGGRHSYSVATARNILSQLRTPDPALLDQANNPLQTPQQPLNIRVWRRVEQEALMRLYSVNTQSTFGTFVRSDATWRWLLNRHSFEQVYVAINGTNKMTIQGGYDAILGYAIVHDGQILELMTDGSRDDIATGLLERICGDVIEQTDMPIRLDAPHNNPLHEMLLNAGGQYYQRTVAGGEVILAKVLKPLALTKQLRHQFNSRVRAGGLDLPLELGLCIDGKKYTLNITPRSAKVTRGKIGRNYISVSKNVFSQLLIGVISATEAAAKDQLQASTRIAAQFAETLFPQLPMWLPPLDDLLA